MPQYSTREKHHLGINKTGNVRITSHWARSRITVDVEKESYCVFVIVCVLRTRAPCVLAGGRVPGRLSVCMRVRACSLTYPACNAYAPYCDEICGLSGSTVFFDITLYRAGFSEKIYWIQNVCFDVSLQILPKMFLILKRIQRDIVTNVKISSCKVPVILVRF
jgi:hypothetical protein